MRQALFNILSARIANADFLDIFAGSGLVGLEALSRGVASLTAIEEDRVLAHNIQAAVAQMGYEAEIIATDFRRAIPTINGRKFDIIFADPPYGTSFGSEVLSLVAAHKLLKPGGILVVEHSARACPHYEGDILRPEDYRRYGQSAFSFFELA
jgi:16S rRNA (guanine(966)-N(2))-methyltransferase RsmD